MTLKKTSILTTIRQIGGNLYIPLTAVGLSFAISLAPLLSPATEDTRPTPLPTASIDAVEPLATQLLIPESPLKRYRNKTKLTAVQLSEILAAVGFKGDAHKVAWALAMRESMGKPTAHRVVHATADNSYGLFQINMRGYLGPARAKEYGIGSYDELLDPVKNAQVAFKMSKRGTDFGPWGIGIHAYRSNRGMTTIASHFADYPGYPELPVAPAKVKPAKYIYVNPGVIDGK